MKIAISADSVIDLTPALLEKYDIKIVPLGMKGSKKVKDIFIDLKVPIENRNEVPILCFDNEIAWLVGYKVSESFKITKETKNIIKITVSRKE